MTNPKLRISAAKRSWPADAVEQRELSTLVPYAQNARTHTDAQVSAIANSMREFGWTMPLLVDERDELIAGHGRVLVAQQLGFTSVPVLVARGWSQSKIRAYRLADNKLTLMSDWDFDVLRAEITDLRDMGIDLDAAGFSAFDIEQLFAADANPNTEWHGMPEFGQDNLMAFRSVIVHFTDQQSVDKFAKLVKQTLTDKTKFIWYPAQENAVFVDKHFVAPADE